MSYRILKGYKVLMSCDGSKQLFIDNGECRIPVSGQGGSWNDLKDKPFGTKTETVAIVPEQTITSKRATSGHYQHMLNITTKGNTDYIVMFNDKKYSVTSNENKQFGGEWPLSVNSEIPFLYTAGPLYWPEELGDTITLAIYEEKEIVTKIDPKFVGLTETLETVVLEEVTINCDTQNEISGAWGIVRSEGIKYTDFSDMSVPYFKAIVDGEEFIIESPGENRVGNKYFGSTANTNYEDTGEDFYFNAIGMNNKLDFYHRNAGEHTIALYAVGYPQLKPEHLPSGIQMRLHVFGGSNRLYKGFNVPMTIDEYYNTFPMFVVITDYDTGIVSYVQEIDESSYDGTIIFRATINGEMREFFIGEEPSGGGGPV